MGGGVDIHMHFFNFSQVIDNTSDSCGNSHTVHIHVARLKVYRLSGARMAKESTLGRLKEGDVVYKDALESGRGSVSSADDELPVIPGLNPNLV